MIKTEDNAVKAQKTKDQIKEGKISENLAYTNEELSELNSYINEAHRQIETLKEERKASNASRELKLLKKESKKDSRELTELSEVSKELKKQLRSLETIKDLRSEIKSMTQKVEEVSSLKKEFKELKLKSEKSDSLKNSIKENTKAKNDLKELQREFKAIRSEINSIKESLNTNKVIQQGRSLSLENTEERVNNLTDALLTVGQKLDSDDVTNLDVDYESTISNLL
jgi:chromosome segregation ATPase